MACLDNYKILRNLGSGAFGSVKLAQHIVTGAKVAIKVIKKKLAREQGYLANIKREGAYLKKFNHPNIIKLFEYIKTEKVHYLVLEYVSGGELYSLIEKKGKLAEQECKKYFYQVLTALEYSHKHAVAHRDIKPENILLDEYKNIKLGDFGLSNTMKDGEYMKTPCGSANYAAPEVITGQKYCGTEVDVWSLGVLLFTLIAGTLPFDDQHMPSLVAKVKTANYVIPFHVPELVSDLIKKLIVVNPCSRLTTSEIFEHPWLSDSFPRPLSSSKPRDLDREIFESLLQNPLLTPTIRNQSSEDLINNIFSNDNYDLFTVSYEILSHPKQIQINSNILSTKKKSFIKRTRNLDEPWKGVFELKTSPEDFVNLLCRKIVEMNAKWKFINPYHLKVIFKGRSRKFYVKASFRVYSHEMKYFLDFKLEKGNQLRFIDVCCKLYSDIYLAN